MLKNRKNSIYCYNIKTILSRHVLKEKYPYFISFYTKRQFSFPMKKKTLDKIRVLYQSGPFPRTRRWQKTNVRAESVHFTTDSNLS